MVTPWVFRLALIDLLLVALALLALGCTPVASVRPVVKIGLVAPFEGLHRALGYETLYAVKLAIHQYHAASGSDRPLVELVALDDTQDPSHAAEQSHELTLDPDVVGVVGHLARSTTMAALPEYRRARLALVIPVAMPGDFLNNGSSPSPPVVLAGARLIAPTDEAEGAAAARFVAEELKARRVALVVEHDDALAQAFAAEAEARGMEVRRATPHPSPSPVVRGRGLGWGGLVRELLQDPPEAIFFTGGPVPGAEFLQQARRAGLTMPIVGSSAWGDPVLAGLAGDWLDATFYVAPSPDLSTTPTGRRFLDDYVAYSGQQPGHRAALAYDATWLLLEAIARASERVKAPTRGAVMGQLAEIRAYLGAAGEYRFDESGKSVQGPMPVVIPVPGS